MAVTENSYTGNGSTTNYSFTFPYLKSSDIQVQVDAVVQATNTWSLANATTIQFNTAPANNSKIKILRDTTVDNLTATFYAGSAIKSEDLNDNFTQNLYVTQEIGNRSFENTGTSTMIGNLNMGEDTTIIFEGATDNANETILTVADPTADRTITLPDVTGTVVTTGDTATVTATMLAANSVDSSELVDGSVDLSHMSANSVDSDQYVDGSIDLIHMSANSVDSDQYVDGSIDLAHMSANSVDSDQYVDGSIDHIHLGNDIIDGDNIQDDVINSEHIAAGAVDLEHMSANSVDSDQYVDGSIDLAHMSANSVDSDQYVDGSIDLIHMSANSVDSDQYVDGSIDRVHLSADIIDSTKIEDNAVGTEHIADAELTTLAGMQSGTASILAGGTALTSTLTELNMLDGKSIVTSISGSSTDVQLPTAKAVDDRVTALVTDVGGFRPIANETSFPATNPDPDDDAGTIVSVKALASNLTSNGSGVATIANGAGTGNTVTINGMANSDTIEAGKGILVETTSTLHTYTFHRETLAPADITAAKSAVDDFNERYRVNAGEPSSSLNEGDLVYDTNADKMKVYDSTTSAWKEVTSTGDFKYLFLCPAGGTGAPTINGSIATYDLREGSNSGSAASVTNAAQLVVSINGVVQKANAGTSAPAEGFALVDANTIIFSANLPSGASVFIHQAGSAVSIPTPGDDTVSTAKIQAGAVTTVKIGDNQVTAPKTDLSIVQGDIIYGTGTDTWNRLAKGTAGQALIMNSGATAPEWGAAGATIANDANNRVITADGSAGLNGEANLTFDGSTLALTGAATVSTTLGVTGVATVTSQTISRGYESPATVAANWSIGANNNAMFPGPMTVDSGVTVTVPANRTLTVV